jgi:hypothetical protein
MKANEGDKIVCGCGTVAGGFLNDVPDDARVSGNDISLDLLEAENDHGLCPKCGAQVARHLGNHWMVRTGVGWI